MHKELEILEQELSETVDFEEQIVLAERIHNLKMKINGVNPFCSPDSEEGCDSCGS